MRLATLVFAVSAFAPQLAHADKTNSIASGTLTEFRTPGPDGQMSEYATGGGAALTWLCSCDNASFGAELGVKFLSNPDRRLYDMNLSFIASFSLKKRAIAPFMALGFDVVGVEDPRIAEPKPVTMGVHGRLGLHGFATERVYWRVDAGFLGGGPGGITTGAALGYRFGGGSL